ncbi:hypothetical protein EAF00_006670 [Botryotinia globosa]|nr:hypothetical protein EAF00_006670 [Botryotinia globosa]
MDWKSDTGNLSIIGRGQGERCICNDELQRSVQITLKGLVRRRWLFRSINTSTASRQSHTAQTVNPAHQSMSLGISTAHSDYVVESSMR